MFSIFHCCVKATHQQDSQWSVVVCICATICQVLVVGILRSFGVLFPVLMAEFESSRERTGKYSCSKFKVAHEVVFVKKSFPQKPFCHLLVD